MMSITKKILLPAIIIFCFLSQANAQVEILQKNALEQIQNSHTHLIGLSGYEDLFNKYWTVTKGVSVNRSFSDDALVAGDCYISLEGETYSVNGVTSDYHYINLWIPSERAIKRGRVGDMTRDEVSLAHIQLSVHGPVGRRISQAGGGELSNLTPGTLKNYLQQLVLLLQTGKKFLSDDITNKEQLKLLKDKILYCPNDDFYTRTTFGVTNLYTDTEMGKLFEDYKFKYKVIDGKELSDKIIADDEQFYYLIYLQGTSSGKMIVVINSRTGEAIYSRTEKSFSHNLKSGDVKDVAKAIEKS